MDSIIGRIWLIDEFGNCFECGGSEGNHFEDCTYEGTDFEFVSYSSRNSYAGKNSSMSDGEKWWLWYLIAMILGYGVNELIGVVIMIGLIIWVATK